MEVPGRTTPEDLTKSLLYGSEDGIKLFCQPCDTDGPRVPAHGYCQDCAEHLCETCYKSHRKPAPCRNHVLLDKFQMPKSQSLSQHKISEDLTEQCQQHKGKLIEYFCQDHKTLGCSPCITISHRNCKVDHIPDISAKFTTSSQYQDLCNLMKTLQEDLRKIISYAKSNGKMILENKTTIKDEIRMLRQEINRMFDQLEAEMQQQTDDLFALESSRIDSLATRSVKMLKDIESLQNDINKLEDASKHNALYIKAKTNEASVQSFTSATLEIQKKNHVNTYIFKANKIIKNILGSETRMGQLSSQNETASSLLALTKEGVLSKDVQQNRSAEVMLRQRGHYERLTATPAGEIDVRTKSDKTDYCINRVVVIDKDTVAVTDSNNCAVKIVNVRQKKVVSEKALLFIPGGLEILPSGQLAIASASEQKILFLSIPNGLSEIRSLKVNGKCNDLAYCNGKLIITFAWPGAVQILDEKGHIFKTINKDFLGRAFQSPRVTVDRSNNKIYVSDTYLGTITCFNWEGRVTNGYKAVNLLEPSGLLTLKDGSLLVCSSGNHSIHLISPNLEKGRIILEKKDRLKYPYSLALDRERNLLYVGSGDTFNYMQTFVLE